MARDTVLVSVGASGQAQRQPQKTCFGASLSCKLFARDLMRGRKRLKIASNLSEHRSSRIGMDVNRKRVLLVDVAMPCMREKQAEG